MAHLKSTLVRKLEKLFARTFPPPAHIRLDDLDGVIGVIRSDKFAKMSSIDRQDLIGAILSKNLTREEQRRIQVIVGVTPDEETGYLASED